MIEIIPFVRYYFNQYITPYCYELHTDAMHKSSYSTRTRHGLYGSAIAGMKKEGIPRRRCRPRVRVEVHLSNGVESRLDYADLPHGRTHEMSITLAEPGQVCSNMERSP